MRADTRTYIGQPGSILYRPSGAKRPRKLDRTWAEGMRAYHAGRIAEVGIGAEALRNNQRWLAEVEAAIAVAWPETEESAA